MKNSTSAGCTARARCSVSSLSLAASASSLRFDAYPRPIPCLLVDEGERSLWNRSTYIPHTLACHPISLAVLSPKRECLVGASECWQVKRTKGRQKMNTHVACGLYACHVPFPPSGSEHGLWMRPTPMVFHCCLYFFFGGGRAFATFAHPYPPAFLPQSFSLCD